MSEQSGRSGVSCLRLGRRVMLLVGLGAGLWLLGHGTASADEVATPAAVQDASAGAEDAGVPAGEDLPDLLQRTSELVPPTVDVVPPLSAAAAGVEAAPAAGAPVRPGAASGGEDAGSGGGRGRLVERVADAVREVSAPMHDAAATAVQPLVAVVLAVSSDVPVLGGSHRPPVLDSLTRQLWAPPVTRPSAGPAESLDPVQEAAARGAVPTPLDADGAGRPMALVDLRGVAVAPAAPPAGWTGTHVPSHLPTSPAGTPSRTACTGAAAPDQGAADLPAAVAAGWAFAQAPARDVGSHARTVAFDPSFSPD